MCDQCDKTKHSAVPCDINDKNEVYCLNCKGVLGYVHP